MREFLDSGSWSVTRLRAALVTYVRRYWLTGLALILAFGVTTYLGSRSTLGGINLEADMQISSGHILRAYLNEDFVNPRLLTIVPNVRQIYRFEHIPGQLRYLRLDPTDVAGASISVFSVSVTAEGRVVRTFGPEELRSWRLYNLVEADKSPESFNLVSQQGSDFFAKDVFLIASPNATFVSALDFIRSHNSFSIVFVACFAVFLLAGLTTRRGALDAGLVIAIALLAYPLALGIAKLPTPPPPVSTAVGNASFLGYPKVNDYLISLGILILSMLFAWMASRYVRRATVLDVPSAPNPPRKTWISAIASAAVLVWLSTIYFPNLGAIFQSLPLTQFDTQGWDQENFLLWNYLARNGYLPFRDFWFPYGGFYLGVLHFPYGDLYTWLESTAVLWFLYMGLQGVLRRRRVAFVLFLCVFIPAYLLEFRGWYRYLLGVDLCLLYIPAQQASGFLWRSQVPFAVAAGFVFFYEPTQLIYAGTGMLVHSLLAMSSRLNPGMSLAHFWDKILAFGRQRLMAVGIPLAAGVLPILIFLGITGMLPGFLRFQLSLSDQSSYGAIPAMVADWVRPMIKFDTMFLLLFFGLALGLCALFSKRRPMDGATLACLVVGFAGFMVMQKHITRPSILSQVQVYSYLCALLWAFGSFHRWTKMQGVVAALFVGFVAGHGAYRGFFSDVLRSEKRAAHKALLDYSTLAHNGSEFRAVNAALNDRSRYAGFDSKVALIDSLEKELGWRRGEPVYVLGDNPVLYALMGEAPPFCPNNYNCSPISEQKRVVEWLRKYRPRFVLWDPSQSSYDQIPHVVRVPLIYQYVVKNYHPLKAVGPFQILTNSGGVGDGQSSFWRRELGTRVDLGHIPSLIAGPDRDTCVDSGSGSCDHLLLVHFPDGSSSEQGTAVVGTPSGPFQVMFNRVAGKSDYAIDLDRLWFRSLAGTAWNSVQVAGARVNEVARPRRADSLY